MLDTTTMRLDDLRVLVIDCQATAATPGKGHLFEIAWTEGSDDAIESTLVALPSGESMPKRVTQLTGVRTADLRGAPAQHEVVRRLDAALDGWANVVFVAHWARYERAWVEHLVGADAEWLCTHEIARRLLPGLPRKGLRAVAGYLGRPLDDAKRATDHVEATLFVWRELVGLLGEEGVDTLDDLRRWLDHPPRKTDERLYPLAREKRLALPQSPGVYRMLNRDGRVLYVGKATSLKDRVNSYFRQRRLANDKMELVTQVWDLDVTVTESALEAALLETDEIKRLAPPYNHALKADGRDVTWCSPSSFRATSTTRTLEHSLGPFSNAVMCEHFAEVVEFVNGGETPSWVGKADATVLEEARTRFRADHQLAALDVSTLLELGRALFPLPELPDDGPSVGVVTVESVTRMLEWAAVSAHRSVVRGQWLVRLARSRVRWAPHGAPEVRREITLDEHEFESVDTYDRVSVVLTELRRILRDGRDVAVVDAAGVQLDAAALTAALDEF